MNNFLFFLCRASCFLHHLVFFLPFPLLPTFLFLPLHFLLPLLSEWRVPVNSIEGLSQVPYYIYFPGINKFPDHQTWNMLRLVLSL